MLDRHPEIQAQFELIKQNVLRSVLTADGSSACPNLVCRAGSRFFLPWLGVNLHNDGEVDQVHAVIIVDGEIPAG